MKQNPFFSVVIITLNEEHYITTILTSLTQQTYKNFEVIIVDANSHDKTINVVKKFSSSLNLTIYSTSKKNLSISRNLGGEKSKGEFLFFIDADNDITSTFLERMKGKIDACRYNVIIPILVPSNKRILSSIMFKVVGSLIYLTLFTPRAFSTGSSIVIERKYFDKISGYDPEIYVGEDHDIVRRLKSNKALIKFAFDIPATLSTRRFDKEGISTYLKYTYAFIYQIIFSKVKKKIYTYQMGGENY